ncbi:3'-5'-exoribonuclease [Thecaphora frezii]
MELCDAIRVQTSVRATLVPPRSDRPYEGFLQLTTDISAMAGTEYDTSGGATSSARQREVLFDRLLEKAIRRTEALDRESLCVIAGEQVFQIHLTIHLLSDCGAALDAAVLCSMLSLRHFRRPDFSIQDGKVRLYGEHERVGVPLAIHHTPLCVSFAVFHVKPQVQARWAGDEEEEQLRTEMERDEAEQDALHHPSDDPTVKAATTTTTSEQQGPERTVTLVDPAKLEETLCDSKVVMVLNSQREICVLDKAGGAPLEADTLLEALQLGLERVKQLSERVEEELKADASVRIVEVI